MSKRISEKNLRTANILLGITIITIAIVVLLYSVAAVITLLLIISSAVIILGIARLINGYANDKLDSSAKIMKILSGLIAIIFGVIVLISTLITPLVAIQILIILICILLFIIGVARVFVGALTTEYYSWYRILLVIIGIGVIILSVTVFLNLDKSHTFLIFLLAIAILLTGIARLIFGIIGTK
ncbi:MAG: DUF308 domain-containing protein [Candidatus Hodarchaeota archaeon]